MKALGEDEAREIYFASYWNALNCDALPGGVDLVVFDFGVNAGPGRAARLLQRVVATHGDGVVGPATIAAASALDPADAIRRLSSLRLDYYRSLKTWKTFGAGWAARTGAVSPFLEQLAQLEPGLGGRGLAGAGIRGVRGLGLVGAAQPPQDARALEQRRGPARLELAHPRQQVAADAILLAQQGGQQVLREDFRVTTPGSKLQGVLDGLLGLDGQLVEAHVGNRLS